MEIVHDTHHAQKLSVAAESESKIKPIAIGLLDLDLGLHLDYPVREPQDHHDAVRLLVRAHGRPIGFATVPLREGVPVLYGCELIDRAVADLNTSVADGDADAHPASLEDRVADGAEQLPPISVVIATKDRPLHLRRALESLLRVAGPSTEIIIVDNAPSTDQSRRAVEELADDRLVYLREPHAGVSAARNAGMQRASHDLIAFTDDDVVVDRLWLHHLAKAFTDPDVGCVTGSVPTAELESVYQHYFERRTDWTGGFERDVFRLGDRDRNGLYPFNPGIFGTGANFALRRSAIEAVGEFDTRLGPGRTTLGGEDLDYFFRVVWSGRALCHEPAALVWHVHRDTEDGYCQQVYGYGKGFGAYATKILLSPALAWRFLMRVPLGVARLSVALRSAVDENDLPSRYTSIERRGMAAAPKAFLQEWWSQRRSR